MGAFYIFFIRFILSVIISLVICRMFFQNIALDKIIGLAVFIFVLAYLFEYLRKMGKGDSNGS